MFKKAVLTVDRIIERVGNWGLIGGGVLILLMSFLSTYAVARRYLLNNPEPYSYELSTTFLTACVVLAIAGLQRVKRHLRVDFIANYFSPTWQTVFMDIIGPLLALVYVAIIVWQSWNNAIYSFSVGETSQSVWEEPLWPTKLIIPITMFWLCLVLISQLTRGIITVVKAARLKAHPDENGNNSAVTLSEENQ